MRQPKDYSLKPGQRFGRWIVLDYPPEPLDDKNVSRRLAYHCQCDCGTVKLNVAANLIYGDTKSCGCYRAEMAKKQFLKHGEKRTRLYNRWSAMIDRCENPNNKRFDHYGGRGISICKEWRRNFLDFKNWALTNGYGDKLSLERINVNGDYTPENCTWIPFEDQARNKKNARTLTAFEETKSIQDWSRDPRCIVNRITLYSRIKLGWDVERALSTKRLWTRRNASLNKMGGD